MFVGIARRVGYATQLTRSSIFQRMLLLLFRSCVCTIYDGKRFDNNISGSNRIGSFLKKYIVLGIVEFVPICVQVK
jgi:hypothetical protein